MNGWRKEGKEKEQWIVNKMCERGVTITNR